MVLVVYAVLLLASISMVAGPFYNDYRIAQHPGRALAHVTAVGRSVLRWNIRMGRGSFILLQQVCSTPLDWGRGSVCGSRIPRRIPIW